MCLMVGCYVGPFIKGFSKLGAPGTVLSLNLHPFCIGVLQFEQMSSRFSALVLVSPSALINQAFSAVNESLLIRRYL